MKRKVFLGIVASLLVFSMVYVFAQGPMMNKGDFHKGKGMQMREFIEDLDLTPEQESKLVDIKFAHQQEILPLQRDLEKKRLEFKAELEKENPNQQVLDKISDEMSALMGKIKKSKLHFLLSMKSVLTNEQWKKAKEHFMEREGGGFGHNNRNEMRKGCKMMPQGAPMAPPPPPPQE